MRLKREEIFQQFYDLHIGEFFAPDNNSIVTRVPGGWIWGDLQGCCFIPYINIDDSNL